MSKLLKYTYINYIENQFESNFKKHFLELIKKFAEDTYTHIHINSRVLQENKHHVYNYF